ncbi:MAG: hypothetical protein LBR51_07525 [Bacteroidales bacterium]|jgi:hypothetical protein|nr:hypothetical protein [Bacteroidales bacterium]
MERFLELLVPLLAIAGYFLLGARKKGQVVVPDTSPSSEWLPEEVFSAPSRQFDNEPDTPFWEDEKNAPDFVRENEKKTEFVPKSAKIERQTYDFNQPDKEGGKMNFYPESFNENIDNENNNIINFHLNLNELQKAVLYAEILKRHS